MRNRAGCRGGRHGRDRLFSGAGQCTASDAKARVRSSNKLILIKWSTFTALSSAKGGLPCVADALWHLLCASRKVRESALPFVYSSPSCI